MNYACYKHVMGYLLSAKKSKDLGNELQLEVSRKTLKFSIYQIKAQLKKLFKRG